MSVHGINTLVETIEFVVLPMLRPPELRGFMNDDAARWYSISLHIRFQCVSNEGRGCLFRQMRARAVRMHVPGKWVSAKHKPLTEVIKGLCDAGTHGHLFIEVLCHIKADPDKTGISRQADGAPGNAIRFVVLRRTEIPGTQRLLLQRPVGPQDRSAL